MSKVPLCTHIKTNGLRCKSPALRGRELCFFHYRFRERQRQLEEHMPPLEDANAIQFAIMQVIRAVLDDRIDLKKANTVLYGLQIANSNMARVRLEPWSCENPVRDLSFRDLKKRLTQLVADVNADAPAKRSA